MDTLKSGRLLLEQISAIDSSKLTSKVCLVYLDV